MSEWVHLNQEEIAVFVETMESGSVRAVVTTRPGARLAGEGATKADALGALADRCELLAEKLRTAQAHAETDDDGPL